MGFSNSRQYLEKYKNLKDGYYEYLINGTTRNLYTKFEDSSGWIRVVVIDWDNRDHVNRDEIVNVKLNDHDINFLRSDEFDYNIMASAEIFKDPFNEWIRYPHNMYVHKSMIEFNSISLASAIPNSNLVSIDLNAPPLAIYQDTQDIGFGGGSSGIGDTFFAYNREGRNGLVQSFCGSARGAIYVR
jgi:hypothetical protein